jgi:AcrR family transcriptional regulator
MAESTDLRPVHYSGLPSWLPGPARGDDGSRRRSQGEDTFRRLLEAARTVFAQHGHAAARVDDVVALAGTSHGTFYLYFRNKQELLHYLAIECGIDLDALTGRLRALPADFSEADLGGWVLDLLEVHRRHIPVLRVWVERRDLDPLMQALADDKLGALADALHDRIDPAVLAAIGSDMATLGVMAMLDRMSTYVHTQDSRLTVERAVPAVTTMLAAVMATGAAGAPVAG